MPDNSTLRSESLEDAVQCLSNGHVSVAVAAMLHSMMMDTFGEREMIEANGHYNLESIWVSSDPNSGWVELEVKGDASGENCTYIAHGGNDETVAHSRSDIPAVLSIKMMEEDLTDQTRYPALSGPDGLFTSSGDYHPETRVGILVVTPDSDFTDWLSVIEVGDAGATTLDITRTWNSTLTACSGRTRSHSQWMLELDSWLDGTLLNLHFEVKMLSGED